MKKVALIQSNNYFTPTLKKKYLGEIPVLTSTDPAEIYKFIKKNVQSKCIYKYVIHVDSGVLDVFIDYIHDKKMNSKSVCNLLQKCIFIATLSNADSVRTKNIEKKTNIYFNLSPISEVIKTCQFSPGEAILIVSDLNTPYYNQIYNSFDSSKYRMSDKKLTPEKIKEFSGKIMLFAGDTREEYEKLASLIIQSNSKVILRPIELKYIDALTPIFNIISPTICSRNSGQGVCGNVTKYKRLNQYLLYDNSAVVLIKTYKMWEQYIKHGIVSKNNCDYNVSFSQYDNIL